MCLYFTVCTKSLIIGKGALLTLNLLSYFDISTTVIITDNLCWVCWTSNDPKLLVFLENSASQTWIERQSLRNPETRHRKVAWQLACSLILCTLLVIAHNTMQQIDLIKSSWCLTEFRLGINGCGVVFIVSPQNVLTEQTLRTSVECAACLKCH